jgi:solute carrier family 13 (sodium-dependent dicarboxylate transporter), member 2/3/5
VRVLYPVRRAEIAGGRGGDPAGGGGAGGHLAGRVDGGDRDGGTATAWILRPLLEPFVPGLNDTSIAIAGALLLFLVPVDWRRGVFALDWKAAEGVPWSVLLLFGGGLSLAAAISGDGAGGVDRRGDGGDRGVAGGAGGARRHAVVIFLTELTSNTATAASFLPVVAALAVGIGARRCSLRCPRRWRRAVRS